MLDAEFTVTEGPHIRRKFWQTFTVSGGKVDENGVSIGARITKSTLRAMIDSALGLDPEDMSEATKAKRVLRGFADLSGITFVAKIKVEYERQPGLPRQEPARPCRAADRARVAQGHGRRNRAGAAEHAAAAGGPNGSGRRRTGVGIAGDRRRAAAPAWGQGAAGGKAGRRQPSLRPRLDARLAEQLRPASRGVGTDAAPEVEAATAAARRVARRRRLRRTPLRPRAARALRPLRPRGPRLRLRPQAALGPLSASPLLLEGLPRLRLGACRQEQGNDRQDRHGGAGNPARAGAPRRGADRRSG